jgi:nucleoside-diphosphate-sugar epimerase
MKVLLTGAFGNIGRSTIDELLKRGHQVRCFDVPTRANRKAARHYGKKIDTLWGDLRQPEDVMAAVRDQDVVLHVGFVIPKLSVTGIGSEDHPDWAYAVNVGGTQNLVEALQRCNPTARLLFTSSLHIYGRTQDQPPPRSVLDTPHPVEHYARHKVACEQLVTGSGLTWSIFRLGAALPIRLIMDAGMFDVPLNNRIEFVHTRDVGFALAEALQCSQVWGKILHIGGGKRCQLYYREMVSAVLGSVGVGSLPDRAFTKVPFSTDWLDTQESQSLLGFQHHTLEDYARDLKGTVGSLRYLIQSVQPLVRRYLLNFSPYWR